MNSTLMGYGSMLPPQFIGFILLGFSFSAVLVSIVRLICLVSFVAQNDDTYYYSTLMYFGLNLVVLLAITISIPIFLKSNFSKYYLKKAMQQSIVEESYETTDDNDQLLSEQSSSAKKPDIIVVLKKIWVDVFVIVFLFAITFLLFPSITI